MKVLVVGATGRTGRHIVDHLLTAGQTVRILTRPTSNAPGHWSAVERVQGDLKDSTSLRQALSGVDGLFVLSPMDVELDRLEHNVFEAAASAGIAHVVKMSTTKPEADSPIPWWRAHWRSEQALRTSELSWTILRPNGITFFLLEHARGVREHGMLRTAAGQGRMALIDADDIGAVTASVFADPGRYHREVLNLTGPDAVSYGDVADILTRVTGHPVHHVDVSPADGLAMLRGNGFKDWEAEGMVANWVMTRDGSGGFDRVTDVVERVSGRRPLSVEVFLQAHRDAFAPVVPAQ